MQASRHAGNLLLTREATVSCHRICCVSGIQWLYGKRYQATALVSARLGEAPAMVNPDGTIARRNFEQTSQTREQESYVARMGSTTLMKSRKVVVVISGPTAVGKTNVALRVAEMLGGEIISADSVQVRPSLVTWRMKIE